MRDVAVERVLEEVKGLKKLIESVRKGGERPLLLTQTRVAQEMSLSTRTVKRMIARGELQTVRSKTCRRSLVAASEVDRWIREHAVAVDVRQKRRNPKTEAQKIRDLLKR